MKEIKSINRYNISGLTYMVHYTDGSLKEFSADELEYKELIFLATANVEAADKEYTRYVKE